MSPTLCPNDVSSNEEFVDKILKQGQKLRHSMIQSILNNDPFNVDIYDNVRSKGIVESRFGTANPVKSQVLSEYLSTIDKNKIKSFFQGDFLAQRDELEILERLECMPSQELLKTTNQVYSQKSSKSLPHTIAKGFQEVPTHDLTRSCEKYQTKDVSKTRTKASSECTHALEETRNADLNHRRTLPGKSCSKPLEELKYRRHNLSNFRARKYKPNLLDKRFGEISQECALNGVDRQTKLKIRADKRTLIGYLYIKEAEYLNVNVSSFIRCKAFYQNTCCSKLVVKESHPIFNFSQWVPLVYQDELLQQFRDNFMVIEFWKKIDSRTELFGSTKVSLYQFYIAYRNRDVTDRLSNNKLPIISDCWEAIIDPYNNLLVGQVQLLLALGTEQQILNLEVERNLKLHLVKKNIQMSSNRKTSKTFPNQQSGKKHNESNKDKQNICMDNEENLEKNSSISFKHATINCEPMKKEVGVQSDPQIDSTIIEREIQITSSEKLEESLNPIMTTCSEKLQTKVDNLNIELDTHRFKIEECHVDRKISTQDDLSSSNSTVFYESGPSSLKQSENTPPIVKSTSDLLNTLQAALSISPAEVSLCDKQKVLKHMSSSFKAQIQIVQALHLPTRKKCKAKKSRGKTGKYEDNVKPSCYVTFETIPGLDLKISPIVPKSSCPQWNFKSDVFLPSELLFNNKKRFIVKVWRKSTNTTMVPNLQSDLILGFVAIDLTVLLSGFQNIQGWFNIIDFSSRCNGQINIHITPLEDMTDFKTRREIYNSLISPQSNEESTEITECNEVHKLVQPSHSDQKTPEADGELLSRTLKRKFTELDEITQRLRLRLSHVTEEESDDGNDDIADEFEKDINTLSTEDDTDMTDCASEYQDSIGRSSFLCSKKDILSHDEVTKEFKYTEETLSTLDQHILEGKQKIDILLEKLSLMSDNANCTPRYISGCSFTNRSDCKSDSSSSVDGGDEQIFKNSDEEREKSNVSSSSTSLLMNYRAAPDGQGTFFDDKSEMS